MILDAYESPFHGLSDAVPFVSRFKVFLSFRNSAELSKLSMPITLRPRASFVMNSTACCEPGGGVGGCVQLLGAQQLHH